MSEERTAALMERVFMFLEDGEWQKADEYCEKVLDIEPKNAQAYLGKLMAEFQICQKDDLKNCNKPLETSKFYRKILSFGNEEIVKYVTSANVSSQNIALEEKQKKRKIIKKATIVGLPVVMLVIVFAVCVLPIIRHNKVYKDALEYANSGQLQRAICALDALGDYKDSAELAEGLRNEFAQKDSVSVFNQTVAIKSDGTVVATSTEAEFGECNVSGWSDIVAVSAGNFNTLGLKSDGTVVATEIKESEWDYGQSDVGSWSDIISVSSGNIHSVGLKSDGTVVAAGYNDSRCDVESWTGIVAIVAGGCHTVGLRADGTVVAVGSNNQKQCDVEDWTDIVAIAAGETHTVGLKSDGTVIATDYEDSYYISQRGVETWTDIVAISAGYNCTVGLKSDGTVVAIGSICSTGTNFNLWNDIVDISAGGVCTIGFKADGTVLCTDGYIHKDKITSWTDIKMPDNIVKYSNKNR